jgi:hypothetical protein
LAIQLQTLQALQNIEQDWLFSGNFMHRGLVEHTTTENHQQQRTNIIKTDQTPTISPLSIEKALEL